EPGGIIIRGTTETNADADPQDKNTSERVKLISQAAGSMHKNIDDIKQQWDSTVSEVGNYFRIISEQLRSKARRQENDDQMLTIIKQQTEITSLIKGMNSKTDQMRVKLQDCRDVINKKGVSVDHMCTYCGSKEHRHINCQHKFRQCKYCTQSHMSALCDLIFVGPRNEFCATTAEALAGNKSQQMHGKLNAVQPSR
uniref:Uncharacterized protein n=1 Tax=Caenorhabditis japonica TaxID=281687 RepID=A0A8R1IF92_CAEJA